MGVRLAKISPTRGFAAELATALIITIAAQYGLPTSSSQCITGASQIMSLDKLLDNHIRSASFVSKVLVCLEVSQDGI